MTTNKTFENFRNLETKKQSVPFDITTVLKNAVGAYQWQQKDGLWTLISAGMTDFSSHIFQRINNYAKNIIDVDTCQATALKSIAQSVDLPQITDFIKDIYPEFLNSLINTFSIDYKILLNPAKTQFITNNNTSISNVEFLNANKFLSKGAIAEFFGSIDQRNKYTFPTSNGYSELYFLDILQNLDKIKYLLVHENNINLAQSIWSYIEQKNRLEATSLNTTYLFLNDFHQSANPSLNQIFTELQFYRKLNNNVIIQNKTKSLKNDQKQIEIKSIKNYYDTYIGQEVTYLFQKQQILKHCSKILLAKDIKKYKQYYTTFGISQTDHLESILYYWNPYDINIINQPEKYLLINNYGFSADTKIINPFLALIAILKNLAFNQAEQTLMKMSYTQEFTNIYVDLTNIILHAVETIQTDNLSYYYNMIVFHFYGVLYDNIFNNYLKQEWNITQSSTNTTAVYIGKFSEYTKEQFIQLVKNYISADDLTTFILNGPKYYNQYHVDFIKSISILNSIISYGMQDQNNTQKLEYYIPYYNNNINPYKHQSYLYDNNFYKYKQKLLGIFYKFCSCPTPIPSKINNDVCTTCGKIIQTESTYNNFTIDLTESYIYKAALIFADYCIKIKNTRETLKTLVQQYARIGTATLLNDIIGDYFYKQFSKRQSWLLNDSAAKSYDSLSTFNLFLDIINLKSEDTGNQFSVKVQEYYDNTNYLNIYASSMVSALASTNVSSNVSTIISSIITSAISAKTAYQQISTYISSITPSSYSSSYIETFIQPNIHQLYQYENIYAGTTQSYHYISAYQIDIPITTYTTGIGYIPSTDISTYITYIPYNNTDIINANKPFWLNAQNSNKYILSDQQILDQCKFYEQYFPDLKNACTDVTKINIFKTIIYPLLVDIWTMHAVSGFSGELFDLNNYYSGISGKYKIENLVNQSYPTIAPAENIQNLFEQQLLNDYKSGYLIKNYYSQLESYSSGIYVDLFNNTINVSKNVERYSNYYFVSSMFGLLTNGKFNENNNFHGYISNYENQYKVSNDITKIQADGPWKYSFLQKFIHLLLTEVSIDTIGTHLICDVISSNYDYIMDETNFIKFSEIYPSGINLLKIQQNYPSSLHNLSYEKYNKLFPKYKTYINNTYSLIDFDITNNLISQANKLMIFSPAILRLQNYKIADYKQDIYNNHYILFKHYKHDKYEDAGQLWIRYKNKPLAMPFMKPIKFLAQSNSYYNINNYENTIDLFLTDYDQVECIHPTYTKIIKQMVNNAVYFNIYNNICVIVGYTNFVKYHTNFEKNNDYQYLKTVVFKLIMNNDKLVIDTTSIKFITTHQDNDYLLNMNEFVGTYKEPNSDNINIVLYNINQNNININLYKAKNNSENNLFLNNIALTFLYVNYDINTYMLNYKTQTYTNVKFPIIGLYINEFCVDTKTYEYQVSSIIPVLSSNIPEYIWKTDDTENVFAIGYESVSNNILETKNSKFIQSYDLLYKNTRSYIDVLIVKCSLIYKNINNTFLPIFNKFNISLGKDYLDDFKDFEIISGNSTELNAIYNSYPKISLTENKQLIIRLIPLTFGGIKNYASNIIYDYSGIELMQSLMHYNNTTSGANGIIDAFNLLPTIDRPDFKYGLKELVYDFKNHNNLLNRTNILTPQQDLTINDILSTIYSPNQITEYNFDTGLTFNIDLVNNYDPNLYKITNDFVRFLPNISNSILDDMKILINFGTLTNQIKEFLTGTETFDLDISVYIDDSQINGTQHFKKVGWHCGYSSTDYIDWNSNDNRSGGPEIVTIHLKKYYTYLYKKYASNTAIYNNPIFLEKNIIQHTKDCKVVINICWFNESRIISINPNMEIIWNGIYYKKIINRQKINFNVGCCEHSFQQVLHLDLLNNAFVFNEKQFYKVSTYYNEESNSIKFEINTDYYNIQNRHNVIPSYETQIANYPNYIETYYNDIKNHYKIRNWYIFNINKLINLNDNIAIEDKDIIEYFKSCLTYLTTESFEINPCETISGKGIISCLLTKNENNIITSSNIYFSPLTGQSTTNISTYFSNDINYITSQYTNLNEIITGYIKPDKQYIILNTKITKLPENATSSCICTISSTINTYKNKILYLNYKQVYNSNDSKNIVTGKFIIPQEYKKDYQYGYYFDNNEVKTDKYPYGNIFANYVNISAQFNWQNINANIFINKSDPDIIISNQQLSASLFKINNKNIYYNENISAGIIIKNHEYDTKLINNIGINTNYILTGNLQKTENLTSGTHQITISPYYKIKNKIIFLDNYQYSFNYIYYPSLFTYTDKFNTKFTGNNFDIIHTYFIGDKILNTQLLNGIQPNLFEIPINSQTCSIDYTKLCSTNIYYFKDKFDLYKNYLLSSDNETLTSNIEYNYTYPIFLYKFNTEISNLYTIGKLTYYNIYKTIYITPIINNNFIITKENTEISFNLDISITSSMINTYNGLMYKHNDIQFSKYNTLNIIPELSANMNYIFTK